MLNTLLNGLETAREQLIRDFVTARGSEKAELLTRIMDLDDEIQRERETS